MTTIVTKSEYARHRDVHPALITRWSKAGRIKIVDGKVDVEASDAMLRESMDPARGGRGGKRNPDAATVAQPPAQSTTPADTPKLDAYTRVRTFRESFNAKSAEVAYRKAVGELVEREPYNRALADMLGPALQRLDTISSRLGARLAAEIDVRKCQDIIDDEVASIRTEIADSARAMIESAGKTKQ